MNRRVRPQAGTTPCSSNGSPVHDDESSGARECSGPGTRRASHKTAEVAAREGPFEEGGDLLVMVLEAEVAPGDLVLGSEMSEGEGFALQDREADLDPG